MEFDAQVLSLTKVIIDSLNERELKKFISGKISDLKGISKLEQYLAVNNFMGYEDHIKFLILHFQ